MHALYQAKLPLSREVSKGTSYIHTHLIMSRRSATRQSSSGSTLVPLWSTHSSSSSHTSSTQGKSKLDQPEFPHSFY